MHQIHGILKYTSSIRSIWFVNFFCLLFLSFLMRIPSAGRLQARQFAALRKVRAGEMTMDEVLAMGEGEGAVEESTPDEGEDE